MLKQTERSSRVAFLGLKVVRVLFFFFTPNFISVPPIYTTNELLGFPKYFLLYYYVNYKYFISHYLIGSCYKLSQKTQIGRAHV